MDRALDLAWKGWGKTNPNPLVGAVLVKNDDIVAQGYHGRLGGPHAEAVALEKAGREASGTTMYVTLEPCCHYGKTPPCTDKIIEAGVKRVVIASLDPHEKMAGKGVKKLRQAGIKVEVGLKKAEAEKQNEIFRKYIVTGLPYMIGKWGMSLDGKIATHTGDSRWITSEKARFDTHRLRARVAAIMVGIGTVKADDPLLTCRHPNYPGQHPVRIVVDSHLRLSLQSKVLEKISETPTIIATSEEIKHKSKEMEIAKQIENLGGEVLYLPQTSTGKVDIFELVKLLGQRGLDSVLVEGGETLHGSLIEANYYDKYIVYLGNLVIGGTNSPTPVGGKGFQALKDSVMLNNMEYEYFGDSIRIEAYPFLENQR